MTTAVFSKIFTTIGLTLLMCLVVSVVQPAITSARSAPAKAGDQCGKASSDPDAPKTVVKTTINIGCQGRGNPIMDATFGIIHFLSNGVGLVLIGSLVYAGVQYTLSRGDPQATAAAINRIRSTIQALLIFILAYALLNYLIPGRILK